MNDVLVIGGGLAGWRAAQAAARAGCEVALVANGRGNSPEIHALNCPVRPDDSVERYTDDTLASGRGGNDRALVETMCRESLRLKDEFPFDGTVLRPLGSSVPRCVSIGHAIGAYALREIQAELKGKVGVTEGCVEVLSRGGAQGGDALTTMFVTVRRGQGVPALTLETRAVVLATGGWCGKYAFSTNPSYLRGDGLALARALGAAVRDVDESHVQYEPTVRIDGPRRGVPVITTLLHKGARLVNDGGCPFLPDERANKDELSRAISAELARTGADGVWYDLTDVAEEDLQACRLDPSERRIRVAPAAHSSLGGVVIDTDCHVLDSCGAVVPGLFAAGEVTAGVHGFNRLGGNGGTAAMVFGRIAGESAAAYVCAVKGEVR